MQNKRGQTAGNTQARYCKVRRLQVFSEGAGMVGIGEAQREAAARASMAGNGLGRGVMRALKSDGQVYVQ